MGTQRKEVTYTKDRSLFEEGDSVKTAFLLVSGRVDLLTDMENGNNYRQPVPEGHFINVSAIFDSIVDGPQHYQSTAMIESEKAKIQKTPITELLNSAKQDDDLYRDIKKQTSAFMARQKDKILLFHTPVRTRLIEQLIYLEKNFGSQNTIDKKNYSTIEGFSHQHLSEMIISSPETVSRIFRGLKKQGLVKKQGRNIHIPDVEALREVIQPQDTQKKNFALSEIHRPSIR